MLRSAARAVGGSYSFGGGSLSPAFAGWSLFRQGSQGSALGRSTLGFMLPPAFAG